MPTSRLKASGITRVNDPHPRLRFEWSGIVYLDAEDLAVLNEMLAAPPDRPAFAVPFTADEQRQIALADAQRVSAEAATKAAQRAREEADFRTHYPNLAEKLFPAPRKGGDLRVGSIPIKES